MEDTLSHDETLFILQSTAAEAQTVPSAPLLDEDFNELEDMPPPPRPGLQSSLSNDLEPVSYPCYSYALAPFHLLLALWCMNANISRQQYVSLREILCTLQNSLPLPYETLRQACKYQFPILPVRKYKIPVIPSKMPTLSAAEKQLA